jgi:hypothetical protein
MAESSKPDDFTEVTETETTVHTITRRVERGASAPAGGGPSGKNIWREFFSAFLLCVIMAALATVFVNDTGVGEEFAAFEYRLLQGQLRPGENLKVTIVDISNLELKSGITPRHMLMKVLAAVTDQRPAAVGVDIDFSPEHYKFIDSGDPQFFADCLRLRKKVNVPVYLGIFRTRALPSDQWLGFPAFEDLAAALLVPLSRKESLWSLSTSATKSNAEHSRKLDAPTMSSALASSLKRPENKWQNALGKLNPFEELIEERLAKDVAIQKFYIDFSSSERLKRDAIVIPAEDYSKTGLGPIMRSRAEGIAGKIILIGDVSNPRGRDVFINPANHQKIPGVVVHAAAAETLVSTPLYAFPEINGFLLDTIVSVSIVGLIFLARVAYRDSLQEERLVWVANVGGAIIILLFGLCINASRVLWPDFLLLAIGLLLHPTAHKQFDKAGESFRHWIRKQEAENK